MFRTSCVHHQEDHLYMHFHVMFFMHLYTQSSRCKDVLEHALPHARLLTKMIDYLKTFMLEKHTIQN